MKSLYSFATALLLMASLNTSAQTSVTTDIQSQFGDANSILEAGARYYYYPNLDAYYDSHFFASALLFCWSATVLRICSTFVLL